MKRPALYFDGGYSFGSGLGAWAFRHVSPDGEVVAELGGLLVPPIYPRRRGLALEPWDGLGPVTSDHAETIALIRGLEALPEGWSGVVYGDSESTLSRLQSRKVNGKAPAEWSARFAAARSRVSVIGSPVEGHPTVAQVKARPALVHQVWCDAECNRLIARALKRLRLRAGIPVHSVEEGHRLGRALRRERVGSAA